MIPSFLRSLATLVRQLIASGKVVHATESDAVELELLAGIVDQNGGSIDIVDYYHDGYYYE